MKLFRAVSSDLIKECRCFFGITDTKLLIVKRKMKFLRKYCSSENSLGYVNCSQTLPVWNVKCWLWLVTFLHNYFVSTFICLFACFYFIIWCLLLVNKVANTPSVSHPDSQPVNQWDEVHPTSTKTHAEPTQRRLWSSLSSAVRSFPLCQSARGSRRNFRLTRVAMTTTCDGGKSELAATAATSAHQSDE